MTEYLTDGVPGVYFEPTSIEPAIIPVATSTPGFVGYVPHYFRDPKDRKGRSDPRVEFHQPVLVSSWSEFCEVFGDQDQNPYLPGAYLAHAVHGFFENGGERAFVVRVPLPGTPPDEEEEREFQRFQERRLQFGALTEEEGPGSQETAEAEPAAPGLSGVPGEVEPIARLTGVDYFRLLGNPQRGITPHRRRGMAALVGVDEVCMVAIPDLMAGLWERELLRPTPQKSCPYCGVSMVAPAARCRGCRRRARERVRTAERDARLSLIHFAQLAMVEYCEQAEDRIAMLDPVPGFSPELMETWIADGGFPAACRRGHAVCYYPWLLVRQGVTEDDQFVPPCGHMAGIWARIDTNVGVHASPANAEIFGVVDVERPVTDREQRGLHHRGINGLRAFPGRRLQVWGARTLTPDPSLRHLSARRMLTYIIQSLGQNAHWAVFEPNDEYLWDRIERFAGAFLTWLWRRGQLAGATPDQAFRIKCNAETNPPEAVALGQVATEVQVALLKPAEYIVLRIHQSHGNADTGHGTGAAGVEDGIIQTLVRLQRLLAQAYAALKQAQWLEAERKAGAALELAPSSHEAYFIQAQSQLALAAGDPERERVALKSLRRSLELREDFEPAVRLLQKLTGPSLAVLPSDAESEEAG